MRDAHSSSSLRAQQQSYMHSSSSSYTRTASVIRAQQQQLYAHSSSYARIAAVIRAQQQLYAIVARDAPNFGKARIAPNFGKARNARNVGQAQYRSINIYIYIYHVKTNIKMS